MTYPPEPRSAPAPSGGATTIARGVKVEGEFASQGDVVIEGEVHGKISTGGTLTVGSEAVIKADITAEEAVISGLLEGNLTIKKQVTLHGTARVKGDIVAERATIEAGATLDGRVQIGVTPTKQDSPKPAPVKQGSDTGKTS